MAMQPPYKILVVDDEPDLEPLMLQRMRRDIRRGQYELSSLTMAMKPWHASTSTKMSIWSFRTLTCPAWTASPSWSKSPRLPRNPVPSWSPPTAT